MYSSESNDIYRLYLEGAAEDMVTSSLTKLAASDDIIQLFLKKENNKLIFKPEHVALLYTWIRDQHADVRTLEEDYKDYQKFFQNVPLTNFSSYLDFTEKVHDKRDEAGYLTRHKNIGNIELEGSDKENIIENNDEITILRGDDEHKCVKYGKGYGFCISRGGGGNMYGNYRLSKASTFYFIFFKNISKEDERHIMVLDRTADGWEWTFGKNQTKVVHGGWDEIIKQFPILAKYEDKFINKPLTPEEKAYQNKLRAFTKSPSLEKFKEFSYKQKSDVLKFGMLIPLDLFKSLDKFLKNEWISVGPKMSDEIHKLLSEKEKERFDSVRKQQLILREPTDKFDVELCRNNEELYNKYIKPDKELCEKEEKRIQYGIENGIYDGDLIIKCKYHLPNLDNITKIDGSLEVRTWMEDLNLPNLQTSKGIEAKFINNINLVKLQTTGFIHADSAISLNLPQLQTSESIHAYSVTTLNLPQLDESEDIYAWSATSVNLPQLDESGDINVQSAITINLPRLDVVKGKIYISRKTKKIIITPHLLSNIFSTTEHGDFTELFDERDNKPIHEIEIIDPSETQVNLNDSCVYNLMKSFLLKS